jgi:hypothetical protein
MRNVSCTGVSVFRSLLCGSGLLNEVMKSIAFPGWMLVDSDMV